MTTEILYNLHIHIEEDKFFHIVNFKRKYILIMNSSNFFLAELEEMKSCMYRLEAANAGMGL